MTDSSIHLFSEEVDFKYEDERALFDWVVKVVAEEKHSVGFLNIIFTSDDFLLNLNKEHLNHDYYTDILTFQYENNPIEGDLFISVERIQDNADHLGVSFIDELNRVIIHGVLHLLGYNDKSDQEAEEMRIKEDYYLGEKKKSNNSA